MRGLLPRAAYRDPNRRGIYGQKYGLASNRMLKALLKQQLLVEEVGFEPT
jgi:hypothetical protein